MFLSAEEVSELTGYKKPSAQARWLKSEHFAFVVGGDGKLKVLRSVVVERLGGAPAARAREPQLRLQVRSKCMKKTQ
ncbi:DUF4224 domain-containing protein [Pseudomonas paeninsulae]|uniref:DUF4224 domain-containing protein n=1 Tax=Pseudomonas paeninsulae TaxID=3110772 RepID=UPI002D7893AA|nr:DUF4224 domain-containing protein [Pseudomonas sp. IT1137]